MTKAVPKIKMMSPQQTATPVLIKAWNTLNPSIIATAAKAQSNAARTQVMRISDGMTLDKYKTKRTNVIMGKKENAIIVCSYVRK